MMIASMWESMASWCTPTVLFCVTNFIIATIFIASSKHHDHNQNHSSNNHGEYSSSLTPIARVSSFLNQTRSVNLSSYTTEESQHQHKPQSKTANYSSTSRLAQSIYLSPDYVTPPELPESEARSPSQLAPTPFLFERVKSVKFSTDYNDNGFPVQSDQISDSPGQLARVPSFFDRVKSFKIASAFKSVPDISTQTETVGTDPSQIPEHHVIRSASEKRPAEMKKSRSEVRIAPEDDEEDVNLRRPATVRESRNELDEEVDAKADDFISRFKQQLKLQRLESLVRYNEMLNRRM